jgi:hypothetical protein
MVYETTCGSHYRATSLKTMLPAPKIDGYESIDSASRRLGITKNCLYVRIRNGKIRALRVGFFLMLKVADVDAMLSNPPKNGWPKGKPRGPRRRYRGRPVSTVTTAPTAIATAE